MRALKPRNFVDDFLLCNFFKSFLSPVKIIRFDLEKPPKFCKQKMFFFNIYDLTDPSLKNFSVPIPYRDPNTIVEWFKVSITQLKARNFAFRAKHFYSPIRQKYTYLRYEMIDEEICQKIIENIDNPDFFPSFLKGFKYIDTYDRKDYEKYASILD